MLELGGFAESPKVVGGDERDWKSFNYCLAEEYYYAFFTENFEALGEIDSYLLDNIVFWLNYDGRIGQDKENEIKKIKDGTIMTVNNRTFIDAICANRNYSFAYNYILIGNHDSKLYSTCLMYGDDDHLDVLNLVRKNYEATNENMYKMIFNNIFLQVDNDFNLIKSNKQKLYVLLNLKKAIGKTRIPNNYDIKFDSNSYTWSKELKKI